MHTHNYIMTNPSVLKLAFLAQFAKMHFYKFQYIYLDIKKGKDGLTAAFL